MTFKIKGKVQQFLDIFGAVKVLVEEATVEITDKALTFRGYDSSHIAMVDIACPAKSFEHFSGSAKLGVRTEEMMKILKCFDDKDAVLTITVEDSSIVITEGTSTFKNRLVDTTPSDVPLPKVSFEASVEIAKDVLQEALKKVGTVSEFATLEVKGHNSFEVSGRGDIGSASTFPEYDSCEGDAKSVFGLDYPKSILSAVSIEKVKLELANKQPCRLTMGPIRYWLAPRVQD